MITLSLTRSLKCLPSPTALPLVLSFLEERRFISYVSYLDSISLKISSNYFTDRPVKDLKSNGFLDNLSYDSKESTGLYETEGNIAVWTNYARDFMIKIFYNI